MDVPDDWEKIQWQQLSGLLMVIGGPDAGKTTFSRYLHSVLTKYHKVVAFLDGDPGQSRLGPPTTMTLKLEPETWRVFVGSTSPVRHMLFMFAGITKLIGRARQAGAEVIIYDTTGLIDKDQGGVNFKQAKIELTQPDFIVALQRGRELEPILSPFRKSRRVNIIEVKPSLATVSRSMYMRRRYRRLQFTKYFEDAEKITLEWTQFGVFPRPFFVKYGLVALEDIQGYTKALAIVLDIYPRERKVTLMTPKISLSGVAALRVGNITLDPISFEDQKILL